MNAEEQIREALLLWTMWHEGRFLFLEELDDQCLMLEAVRRGIHSIRFDIPDPRGTLIAELRQKRAEDPPYPLLVAQGLRMPTPREFKKGDRLVCVAKDQKHWDFNIGKFYVAAEDSYIHEGREFVELEQNDSWEPGFHFYAENFAKVPS